MAAVRNLFPNPVISRYGDITWPARSPDLFACDLFHLGYLKSQVFKAPAPHTVHELKHRIQQEVKRIPVEMLQVMGDVRKRLTKCLERNGGHLNCVVLKLNKLKHLLFMTFLKSPDSLTHPVYPPCSGSRDV